MSWAECKLIWYLASADLVHRLLSPQESQVQTSKAPLYDMNLEFLYPHKSASYVVTHHTVTVCLQGPKCPLQVRLNMHCAHKSGQEDKLMQCHQQLTDSIEDQLSLASIHYQRSHCQVTKPLHAL